MKLKKSNESSMNIYKTKNHYQKQNSFSIQSKTETQKNQPIHTEMHKGSKDDVIAPNFMKSKFNLDF